MPGRRALGWRQGAGRSNALYTGPMKNGTAMPLRIRKLRAEWKPDNRQALEQLRAHIREQEAPQ